MVEQENQLQTFIDKVNSEYEKVHCEFEHQFWGTKMALKEKSPLGAEYSTEALTETKMKMEAFLGNPEMAKETADWISKSTGTDKQKKVLNIFERTFKCYAMPEAGVTLRENATALENKLEEARNTMKLGFTNEAGEFKEMSSVGLGQTCRTDTNEFNRKAAFEARRSIGKFITENGFADVVIVRNKLAKALGYIDFYDYKVTQAEGFGKIKLFEIMDTLEQGTRDLNLKARERLAADKGADALQPHNTSQAMSGSVTAKLDPYFPFTQAVEQWGRCYAALGIEYRNATMNLDLLDRKHKYSNGFCHWPQPAWNKPDGTWQPTVTNFTSLADPNAVGSGLNALNTLMHEAGHAAHFANITQDSPLFSQERAPMSVGYAENQSMFLDSLVGDAAWRARYAKDVNGKILPFEIHAEQLSSTHPYSVFQLRGMLAVPYFEKALYEMNEEELVQPGRIQALADEIENKIQGGLGPRPLLSVPHILSDEASCYYHGYVMAEMSVHQTRAHFLKNGGHIVDNPNVGKTLSEAYWAPGNSEQFLDLVAKLTGEPLTGKAWIAALEEPLETLLESERKEYDAGVAAGSTHATGEIDLKMHVRLVDGDEVISDSVADGGFVKACKKFQTFVEGRMKL